MSLRRKAQITLTALLAMTACVPIVIHPGATGPVRPWPASAHCPVPARSSSDGPQVVALMNAERAKVGLAPLTLSPKISAVAHAYACELAPTGAIGHEGTDGSKLSERLRRGGVTASMVAENNASFYRTPAQVMVAWMESPHHRENILRANARFVGIGQADGTEAIWVADFSS